MSQAAISPELEKLHQMAALQKSSVWTYLIWLGVAGILAWAWQGAEIRPLALVRDAAN
ncbi:MAG: Phosphate-import permease protein PhnE, partial [Pseudomonadota bacterium]